MLLDDNDVWLQLNMLLQAVAILLVRGYEGIKLKRLL